MAAKKQSNRHEAARGNMARSGTELKPNVSDALARTTHLKQSAGTSASAHVQRTIATVAACASNVRRVRRARAQRACACVRNSGARACASVRVFARACACVRARPSARVCERVRRPADCGGAVRGERPVGLRQFRKRRERGARWPLDDAAREADREGRAVGRLLAHLRAEANSACARAWEGEIGPELVQSVLGRLARGPQVQVAYGTSQEQRARRRAKRKQAKLTLGQREAHCRGACKLPIARQLGTRTNTSAHGNVMLPTWSSSQTHRTEKKGPGPRALETILSLHSTCIARGYTAFDQ
eukprot:6210074-Pleurochrysis_carterae.AAC.2